MFEASGVRRCVFGVSAARRVALVVVGVSLVAASVSCGSDEPVSTERPLTFDEATLLAGVQRDNYLDGGAVVEVTSSFLADGSTLSMRAEVDWVEHTGRALVIATGREVGVTEVYWNETTVFERLPVLNDLLVARGQTGVEFVARPPDADGRQIDRAIALLVGLASEAPDNPVLVQQKQGSAFLRDDVLRGESVQVLRFGDRTIYWLDSNGSMVRFEGNSESLSAPIIIDVIERGAPSFQYPDPGSIILIDAVREMYDALLGA